MSALGVTVFWACQIYTLILIGRVILDLVQMLARDWQPSSFIIVVANLIYKLTDPPLRFLGRYIPPLRLGGVALDLGFIVLFFGVQFIQGIARSFL